MFGLLKKYGKRSESCLRVILSAFFLIYTFYVEAQNDINSELKLPPVFGDHMILQRNQDIPVWGWASAGESIMVELCGRKLKTKADENGEWMVRFDPLPESGPFDLVISGKNTLRFQDVLIGEVWICSGQSNMDMTVDSAWGKVLNAEKEAQDANYPQIRFFNTRHSFSGSPEREFESNGGWTPCSPDSVKSFSATAYFFGRHIHKNLRVPVGLIRAAWGGTPIEPWTPLPALREIPWFSSRLENIDEVLENLEGYKEKYPDLLKAWMKKLEENDPGYQSQIKWFDPSIAATDWEEINLPSLWDDMGNLGSFDGVIWFTRNFDLPADYAEKKACLHLGTIDDEDFTWINGRQIGESHLFIAKRDYEVPEGVLKPGRNVITVRALDTGGHGGFSGAAENMKLEIPVEGESRFVSLSGKWKYRLGCNLKTLPQRPIPVEFAHMTPSALYNGMIAPLIPYAVKGVIWYQGESNAARAFEYRTLFPAMIKSWRKNWAQGDFPFLFVQIANYGATPENPVENDWAELREAQLLALSTSNTAMAVTIDIGDCKDIHPRNKQDLGYRLGLGAQAIAYGEKIVHSGPIYRKNSMKIEGKKIRLEFDHAENGLMAKGEKLKGFSIAGNDKYFVWAKAEIDESSVIVWQDEVHEPVAVRYGWAACPECNLYNKEGLPASPFRTDSWKGITDPER
ncbi:9-O-acetylesterase [Candidatus Sumerlaeota bacterium]|nr:9-O-acetylesterase [Candidatus Sumerlaeota bacterium]